MITIIGDVFLDVDVSGSTNRLAPDAPVPVLDQTDEVLRPGGAGLAALLTARHYNGDVVLITAIGADEAGRRLSILLKAGGVHVVDLCLDGPTPEKIRFASGRHRLLRVDRN